jgi:hypothetical protein
MKKEQEEEGRETWLCPYCEHCLVFRHRDAAVARLAAESHLRRRHVDR